MASPGSHVDRDGAARCVIEVRRMMKDAITAELVLNPAIDMLLALYLARHDGGSMSSSEVCARTSVTADVCRHWGKALAHRGLILVEEGRYTLSDEGRRTMDDLNDRVWALAKDYLGTERPYA